MKEIVAEGAAAHRVFDVRVGRRDDARGDRERGVAAEPLHALVFDDPQQLALAFEGKLGDGVEVNRAGPGQLEASGPGGDGVGKRAALVAEQLRVNQRRRQACAINRHKGKFRPGPRSCSSRALAFCPCRFRRQ